MLRANGPDDEAKNQQAEGASDPVFVVPESIHVCLRQLPDQNARRAGFSSGGGLGTGLNDGTQGCRFAQGGASMEEASLRRGDGNIEDLGGFFERKLAELSNFDDRTDSGAKLANSRVQDSGAFAFDIALFGIWRIIGNLQMESGLAGPGDVIGRDVAATAVFAADHERGIHDDAGDPGGKRGFALEGVDMHQGAHERILHGVFGVFLVASDAQSDLHQTRSETLAESLKR